jgi:hypothetical protein
MCQIRVVIWHIRLRQQKTNDRPIGPGYIATNARSSEAMTRALCKGQLALRSAYGTPPAPIHATQVVLLGTLTFSEGWAKIAYTARKIDDVMVKWPKNQGIVVCPRILPVTTAVYTFA